MIFINLDTIETVNNLAKTCDKYDKIYIDVIHGRYTVNGRSVLGVCSLMGNIVKVVPDTDDNLLITYIIRDLKEIGAWVEDSIIEK